MNNKLKCLSISTEMIAAAKGILSPSELGEILFALESILYYGADERSTMNKLSDNAYSWFMKFYNYTSTKAEKYLNQTKSLKQNAEKKAVQQAPAGYHDNNENELPF